MKKNELKNIKLYKVEFYVLDEYNNYKGSCDDEFELEHDIKHSELDLRECEPKYVKVESVTIPNYNDNHELNMLTADRMMYDKYFNFHRNIQRRSSRNDNRKASKHFIELP